MVSNKCIVGISLTYISILLCQIRLSQRSLISYFTAEVCQFVGLFVCLFVCPSVCMSAYQFVSQSLLRNMILKSHFCVGNIFS